MRFYDYPAYVMACLGIGDIVCSLNALENLGRERGRHVPVYVVDANHFARARVLFEALDLREVSLHFSDLRSIAARYGEEGYTIFSAFGMDVSWVDGWPRGWGLQTSLGAERMAPMKEPRPTQSASVGVSFTVNFHPAKNLSRPAILREIEGLLHQGRDVIYFGYRPETDAFLTDYFGPRLRIHEHDLQATIRGIAACREFIGADSGMAWLAAFARVPTRVLLRNSVPSAVFREIPWVTIETRPD